MYCKQCNSYMGNFEVCPVCGWYKLQDGSSQSYNSSNTNNQYNSQPINYNTHNQQGYNNQYYSQQTYGQGTNQLSPYNQNQGAYNQSNYNQSGYSQNGYSQNGYSQNGYSQSGYNQSGYSQNGYNQNGYSQNGYNQSSYSQAGFNQPGYNQGLDVYGKPYVSPGSSTKQKKKWPIIVAITSVVVVLGVVLAIVLWPDDVRDYTDPETTENIVDSTEPTTEDIVTTTESTPTVATGGGTKTIMMYVVGSDLESEHDCATIDISEITSSGFDEENINYLIYTGGSKDWDNPNITDDKNCILKVDNGDLTLLEEEEQKNMGDSDTLSDFINYCYEGYPADQYYLILWNHGGGSFNGYGFDELTNDCLSLMELDNALAATPFEGDNKLEFIGFDACLMATIEVADALSPYANYLVASQEPEPGFGWDYSFLSEIEKGDSAVDIGTLIVDNYIATAEEVFAMSPFSYSDVTLSILDLNQVDEVETALDDMYAIAKDDLTPETYNQFSKMRAGTKEIAPMYSGEYSYDFVDMIDMTDKMSAMYPSEANTLKSAISNMIVYQDANVKKEYGVSIYYPYNAKDYSQYYVPMFKTFDFAPNYTSYIESFRSYLTNTQISTAQWDPESMVPTSNGDLTFSLELTPEQAAEVQNAYYVISREDTNNPGNYVFVSMSNQVSFDDTTKVTAPFDGNIIYVQNDTTGEMSEIMYTEQEATDDYTRYLISSILFEDSIDEEEAMYTYFVLETTPSNPQGDILGAYPIANLVTGDANEIFPDRYEINVDDYSNVAFGYFTHEFTSSEDLTNFNEADWADLTLMYNYMPVSDGFSTVMGGMQSGIQYYGMFIFEDTQGNRHSSNIVPIQ